MKWFERGDVDGFFGLALDNFVQLLLIHTLCKGLLGFPDALIYERILPGVAISLLVGNLFYAWQAKRLAAATGRHDVCALPYGINTPSVIGYVFLVMLPAKSAALAGGATPDAAAYSAWQAGLIACLGSALIECAGAFVAERIRKATPRAALLATLAGIALTFIALAFVFQTFAHPAVGLTTLAIILLVYFGGVRFKGGLPGGFVAVAVGTAIAWYTGIAGQGEKPVWTGFHAPIPVVGDLVEAFRAGYAWQYISIIIPMGVFNVAGSLQNIESAEAAGDPYPTQPSLLVNGIGSFCAALFGSCFPTTIYIGHPGWKALGSRAGYSILNGAAMTVICLTGTLAYIAYAVPIDAGMAIVLWIGIVICAQAFQAVSREHAPAVVVGLLPAVGAWGAFMAKSGVRAANMLAPESGVAISEKLTKPFLIVSGTWIEGAYALEQGFIFSSMILAAMTVAIIERRFVTAAIWCGIAALLSFTGFVHSYQYVVGGPGDTVVNLFHPATEWGVAYLAMAAVFLAARFVTVKGDGH